MQNSETDKIAIIAAAIASAIWIYEQVKLDEGLSVAMILCIIFIISGMLYLMTTGLAISINSKARIRKKLAAKTKNGLYNFTIKYFWYTILYLAYLATMSIFDIQFKTANIILTALTIIFGVISIISLFDKPQKFIESILAKIDKLIKNPEDQ